MISISYAAAAGSEAGSEASGFSITLVGASSPLVFPEGFLAGLVGVHLVAAAVDLLLGRRGRLRVCAGIPMDDYKHLPPKEGRAWTMPFNASSDRIYHSKCTLVFDAHSTDCFKSYATCWICPLDISFGPLRFLRADMALPFDETAAAWACAVTGEFTTVDAGVTGVAGDRITGFEAPESAPESAREPATLGRFGVAATGVEGE